VRFAQRVKLIEDLPAWRNKSNIAHVRGMYVTSFKELRLSSPSDREQFATQIQVIKDRHSQTNLLVGGFKEYSDANELPEDRINEWLDRFFALRVSTNMLMSQYLQISSRPLRLQLDSVSFEAALRHDFDLEHNPYRSYVDPVCQPSNIAQNAAELVQRLCRLRYGVAPRITVENRGGEAFPFVPRYLFYVLSELLKNSVVATVETHLGDQYIEEDQHEKEESLPPVTVLVSGDSNVCSVRVSDEGGGIAVQQLRHVWSYLYTTAEPIEQTVSRQGVDAPEDLRRLRHAQDDMTYLIGSPLAGMGCGLPLSRLYARYLGGDIELQTLPRHGTDVFVYLNRLGNSSESLKTMPHI